jgi:hypothetical protein
MFGDLCYVENKASSRILFQWIKVFLEMGVIPL